MANSTNTKAFGPSSERQLSTVTYRIVHAGHGQDHVPNPRQFELQYYWAVLQIRRYDISLGYTVHEPVILNNGTDPNFVGQLGVD